MAPPVRMWSTALLMTVLANSLKAKTCEYSGRKLCTTFTVMLQWSRSILLKLDEALDFMEKRQGMCMIIVRRSAVYSLSFKNSHEIIQSMIIVQLENNNHSYHMHNPIKMSQTTRAKLHHHMTVMLQAKYTAWCIYVHVTEWYVCILSMLLYDTYVRIAIYIRIYTKDRMNLFITIWMHMFFTHKVPTQKQIWCYPRVHFH